MTGRYSATGAEVEMSGLVLAQVTGNIITGAMYSMNSNDAMEQSIGKPLSAGSSMYSMQQMQLDAAYKYLQVHRHTLLMRLRVLLADTLC